MADLDDAPDPGKDLDEKLDDLVAFLEGVPARERSILIGGMFSTVSALATGFAVAWVIANEVAPHGRELPTWPGWLAAGLSLAVALLSLLRVKAPDLWKRNTRTLVDNLFLLVLTTGIGIALFFFGRAST